MEYLQQLLEGSEIPLLTAFLAGLLTAISPCPLATNVTAVGFLSRTLRNAPEKRYSVFWNGLLYSLGRCTAYTFLGMALSTSFARVPTRSSCSKPSACWAKPCSAPH